MAYLEPGTYRITNVGSGTAVAIPEHNVWDVVCWQRNDNKNQQWFVQRSGAGYRFKNCRYGHYLAISETIMGAPVYAGRFPTSWQLIQNKEDHNMYALKCGDVNRVMDLDKWGAGHNGNHIHAYPQDHWVPHKRWRFERLSDETDEDGWQLRKEVAEKNEQLAELAERLAKKDEELARVQKVLSEKSAPLEQNQKTPRRPTNSLKSQNLESEVKEDSLKAELSQQQKETASLRDKMGMFERLISQMMDSGIKRPNNMT